MYSEHIIYYILVNDNHSLLFTLLCTLGCGVSRFRGRVRFGWPGRARDSQEYFSRDP